MSSVNATVANARSAGADVPAHADVHRLRRRLLQLAVLVVAVVALLALVPGLAGVRARFRHAAPGWLAVAGMLELLSCLSYVAVFRAAFCSRLGWRTSYLIGMAELAANSLLPAGGAGGLALGAWALRRGGLPAERIARRTVAFFLVTSAANVTALALVGVALALGLLAGHAGLGLTLGPAAVAVAAVAAALRVPRLARRARRPESSRDSRARRLASQTGVALGDGVEDALTLLRARDPWLLAGAAGYLAFDVAVMWAAFRAFGPAPPVGILLIAYLVGQLGGLIPLPGGIGGVEGGLIGALVIYGVPAAAATAAVLAYRALLLLLPAVVGGAALLRLRRVLGMDSAPRFPCAPGAEDVRPVPAIA